uniref:Uncharacterized protein n=1 Tax=Denticeps clupeoides TaxID=299321 RepID=A0AAY4A0F4_9TELE
MKERVLLFSPPQFGDMAWGATPELLLLLAAAAATAVAALTCVVRRRRRTEGSYQPSHEEQKQARRHGVERPGLELPLPKEERLI